MYTILISGIDRASLIRTYESASHAEEIYEYWVGVVQCPGKCYAMTVTLFDNDVCPIKSYTPSFGFGHLDIKRRWLKGFDRGINLARKFAVKMDINKIKSLRLLSTESMYSDDSFDSKLEWAEINGYYAGLLSERR